MTAPAQRRDRLDATAVTVLVACCLVWGLGQVAAKVAMTSIPPLLQAGARSLGAAVLLLAWSAWRGVPLFQRDGTLRAGLAAGVLFTGEFAAIFLGLQFTTASRLTTFVYLAPFVVALGMPWLARSERLGTAQWAGLCAAFGGVAVALSEGWQGSVSQGQTWRGDVLALLGALLWGGTTLLIRGSSLASASAEKTLLYQLAVCGVALLAAGAATGERWPAQVGALALASLAFQTVVIAFASFLAWFWLMGHYPATRLASFTLLTPVSGLAFGVVLLGEPLTASLAVAVAGVATGLWLVNRR